MAPDAHELSWAHARVEYSLTELAEHSRLSAGELRELVDCGVLAPHDPTAAEQRFALHALASAQTAARLRDDFELDLPGIALAMRLLQRIGELETELCRLQALQPPGQDFT